MKLYLELVIDGDGNKFIISNEKTEVIDDDQVYLQLVISNREIFSYKDSFAFEIGDILYRWLIQEEGDLNYNGSNFLTDFIENEEKWDNETPFDMKLVGKSEYSKYWLFSSYDIDIFSYSQNQARFLLITEKVFEKGEGKIIYRTLISKETLLTWRNILEREYLPRLERERKLISKK